jgi:hydroxymethylbilane synthase
MAKHNLKIATRESPLALWQANHIKELLMLHWPELEVDLVTMKTTGDKFLKDKLLNIGGKGLFVKELEEALLDGRADLAVHSMKDVPASFPDGLNLAAICKRHDPFDALVSVEHKQLSSLPQRSVVGTVSLRRQTQLLALRPDLIIKPLRGNILTRIEKLKAGEYDAIVLAISGLERMERTAYISERFDDQQMLPACGQGAIGIECREEDTRLLELLKPLNDKVTSLCVSAERKVNRLLGGNCHAPLAVYCAPKDDSQVCLKARLLSVDGLIELYSSQTRSIDDVDHMAEQCATILLEKGAKQLISDALQS